MNDLFLTIHKKYFDEILLGLKREEYRIVKPFFQNKIIGKSYKTITFQNGYSKNAPRLTAQYLGWDIVEMQHDFFGKNQVRVFRLKIGKILDAKNLKKL